MGERDETCRVNLTAEEKNLICLPDRSVLYDLLDVQKQKSFGQVKPPP